MAKTKWISVNKVNYCATDYLALLYTNIKTIQNILAQYIKNYDRYFDYRISHKLSQ